MPLLTNGSLAGVIAVLAITAGPTDQTRASQEVGNHTFTLDLPAGYTLQAEGSPSVRFKTFGYSTDVRADGTRGLIQVTLIDLANAPGERVVDIEGLAAALVAGVRSRRVEWNEKQGLIDLTGVPARRIEWSGSPEIPSEPWSHERRLEMRGVMIVGIKEGMGFALHTQDVEPHASRAIPEGEEALMTFTLVMTR